MKPVGAKGSLLCLIIMIFSVFIATSSSWNMIFALSCRRWDVVKSPDDAQLNSDPGEHLHWFIAKTANLQKEEIIHAMFPSSQLHPTWLPVRSSNSCHTICRYFILFWGVRRKLDSFVSSQHGASCRLLTEPVQAGAAFPPGSWWERVWAARTSEHMLVFAYFHLKRGESSPLQEFMTQLEDSVDDGDRCRWIKQKM